MSGSTLQVPKKLLHINETAYTDKWAKDNYQFFHLFDRSINWVAPRQGILGNEDLINWKNKAISLAYNIKNKGLIAGRKEMVRIANEEYGLTVPGRVSSDNTCKDIDDIFCIIGNREWYFSDVEYSRNVIYHLLYLISRPGYNSWLINAEKEWMVEHGVSYETKELNKNNYSHAKGFVYSIMNSTFANTTQKAFRKKLLFLYQEFITVRNRKKFAVSQDFVFVPYVFKNTYKGYIVTPKKQSSTRLKTLPDIFRTGKNWIQDCKALKMDLEKINLLVEQFYNNKRMITTSNQQLLKNPNGKSLNSFDKNDDEEFIADNISGKQCYICKIFYMVFINVSFGFVILFFGYISSNQ